MTLVNHVPQIRDIMLTSTLLTNLVVDDPLGGYPPRPALVSPGILPVPSTIKFFTGKSRG